MATREKFYAYYINDWHYQFVDSVTFMGMTEYIAGDGTRHWTRKMRDDHNARRGKPQEETHTIGLRAIEDRKRD